jgi:hypothetical protein
MYNVFVNDNKEHKDIAVVQLDFAPSVGLLLSIRSLEILAEVQQVIYFDDNKSFRVMCKITDFSGCYKE